MGLVLTSVGTGCPYLCVDNQSLRNSWKQNERAAENLTQTSLWLDEDFGKDCRERDLLLKLEAGEKLCAFDLRCVWFSH